MLSLLKPLMFGSNELRNLIFQGKDIYCLLEEFVKRFGDSFDNLYKNDDNLKQNIDDNYNDLILKIQKIISDQPVKFDFIPKNGSVTIEKLSKDVLNLISCNVSIDPVENIITDLNSGKKYKLIPADAEPVIVYGDIEITEFKYPASVLTNQGLVPVINFKQDKIITYPDGTSNVEEIEGDETTVGVNIIYSADNVPNWITFSQNRGTIVANYNRTFDDVIIKIKATVEWNNKTVQTNKFTLIQPAAHITFTPSSKNIDITEQIVSIDIDKSPGIEITDVISNKDFCTVDIYTDNNIRLFIDENTTTFHRQADITVKTKLGDNTKNYSITIVQAGKVVVNEFYYGGATNENFIPVTTEGMTKTTSLSEISYAMNSSDRYKCLVVNVPDGYGINYIKDPGGNIKTMASGSPATNGDRKIYYTKESSLVPLSGTFKIQIKKI